MAGGEWSDGGVATASFDLPSWGCLVPIRPRGSTLPDAQRGPFCHWEHRGSGLSPWKAGPQRPWPRRRNAWLGSSPMSMALVLRIQRAARKRSLRGGARQPSSGCHGLCSLASPLLHPCASLDPGTRWLPDSISCVVHGAASWHGARLSSQSAAGDPAAHLNPCSSAGSTSLPAAAVLGGSWLPATVPIAVCTHSPCSAKYLTYSPMRWDKEKSQALFVTSQCPRKQRPAYRPESGCGLACSAPSPTIEQLIWGFPEPHWTLPR